ncbi:SOS response-associated peptidase [Luteibacter aegosomatissinici]|uniref:SOS response-associated peptidase n=1 Tax=Luteibacter aegosomatissinici TaxID=2911539 RepID=UPI002111EB13|nr:SOS response-associated peptidase [Luteibacter aegosomatissinici]
MCGRYATYGPASMSREARDVLERLELDLSSEINQREDHFNIAPTQRALVVTGHEEGHAETGLLRWGLIPSWAKDPSIGARMINARREGLAEKPAFRAAVRKRRCLVPASGYFEWQGEKGSKQPYFIRPPDGSLLLFAGLWEIWRGADGEPMRTYTIITGEPGKVGGDIHDRQPVILAPDAWEDWLFAPADVAMTLLEAANEPDLVYYPVTKAVGSPKNDTPDLVEPL